MFIMLLVTGLFVSLFYLTSGVNLFNSDVVILTSSNFNSLVKDSDEVWLVEFFETRCDLCEVLAPEYAKAATALREMVKFGAVNVDNEGRLAERFGVREFPTIKIFGADKSRPVDYDGAGTAEGIINSALDAARKKVNEDSSRKRFWGSPSTQVFDSEHVTKLNDENFASHVFNSGDFWVVDFYKSVCRPCKTFAPEWAKAAQELTGKAKFGSVDVLTQHSIGSQFQIKKTPVVYFFNRHSKGQQDGVKYEGSKTSSDVVSWVLEMIQKNTPTTPEPTPAPTTTTTPKPTPAPTTTTPKPTTAPANTTTPKPTANANNTTTPAQGQNVTNQDCAESPFCFIKCLSQVLECRSKYQNNYIDVVKKVLEIFMNKFWQWILLDSGSPGGFGPRPDIGQPLITDFKPSSSILSDNRVYEFLRECVDSKLIKSMLHDTPNSFSWKPTQRESEVWNVVGDVLKRWM